MISYQIADHPPHLDVRLEDVVSEEDVRDTLRGFEDALDALPPNYVALVGCTDLSYLTSAALGPLYYYVVQVADTEPELTILLYGDYDPTPHLAAFLRRLVPGNRVRVARSAAEARRYLRQAQKAEISDS